VKTPIVLFILSLSLFTGFAWHFQRQLSAARATQLEPVEEAAPQTTADIPPVVTQPVRPDRSKELPKKSGHAIAASYLAWAENAFAPRTEPGPPDAASQQQFLKLIDQMAALESHEMKALAVRVSMDETLNIQLRRGLMDRAVRALTPINPANAVDAAIGSQDLLKDDPMPSRMINHALFGWSQKDFPAALDWLRKNSSSYPELIDDVTKGTVVGNYDGKDYAAAFALIGEVGIAEPYVATQGIVNKAKTVQERTAVLAALRDYLPTISNKTFRWQAGDYALASLGSACAAEGFEPATEWAESAQMTPIELGSFSKQLGSAIKPGEESRWIEWFGKQLQPDRLQKPVDRVIDAWVKKDHKAISTWLTEAPEGPGKQAAIYRFATSVAYYEPETAAQWALTLPADEKRKKCLIEVYCNWPKKDEASKAAAEAFAQLHHLK